MNLTVRKKAFWLVCSGAVLVAKPVAAIEPADVLAFNAGPISLRPRISVGETFNDNILYRPSGPLRQSDFITYVSPGLTATLGRKERINPWVDYAEGTENYVSLGYSWNRGFYASHPDLNSSVHNFNLSNRIKGNRLLLEGRDNLIVSSEVIGGGISYGQLANRTVYSDNYRLSYTLTEKTKLYLVGAHDTTTYENGTPLYNYNTLAGTFGFEFAAREKISLFGEVYYGQSATSPNRRIDIDGPHENFEGGYLGVLGQFTPRLKGSVKAGYEMRDFSNNVEVGGSPVVRMDLTYRFRERTMATLNYSRASQVSVQAAGVTYNSDTLALDIQQRLGSAEKLKAGINVSYEMDSYDNFGPYAARSDDWLRAELSVTYLVRLWMAASVSYEFEKLTSSTLVIINYDVNRIALKVAVGF